MVQPTKKKNPSVELGRGTHIPEKRFDMVGEGQQPLLGQADCGVIDGR